MVTQTAYFAVSDEHGKFIVDQLPAGPYQVEIWHEKLGMKSMKMTVEVTSFYHSTSSTLRRENSNGC